MILDVETRKHTVMFGRLCQQILLCPKILAGEQIRQQNVGVFCIIRQYNDSKFVHTCHTSPSIAASTTSPSNSCHGKFNIINALNRGVKRQEIGEVAEWKACFRHKTNASGKN